MKTHGIPIILAPTVCCAQDSTVCGTVDCMAGRMSQGTKEPHDRSHRHHQRPSPCQQRHSWPLTKATFRRLAADLNCRISIQIAISWRPTNGVRTKEPMSRSPITRLNCNWSAVRSNFKVQAPQE